MAKRYYLDKKGIEYIQKITKDDKRQKKWMENKTIWDIEVNENYFTITPSTMVDNVTMVQWSNDKIDTFLRDTGCAFLTEQDAKDEIRKRKLVTRAKKSQQDTPKGHCEDERRYGVYVEGTNIAPRIINDIDFVSELGTWGDYWYALKFIENNMDDLIWYFGLDRKKFYIALKDIEFFDGDLYYLNYDNLYNQYTFESNEETPRYKTKFSLGEVKDILSKFPLPEFSIAVLGVEDE